MAGAPYTNVEFAKSTFTLPLKQGAKRVPHFGMQWKVFYLVEKVLCIG